MYAFACIAEEEDEEDGDQLGLEEPPSVVTSWTRPTVERVQSTVTNPDSIEAILLSPVPPK